MTASERIRQVVSVGIVAGLLLLIFDVAHLPAGDRGWAALWLIAGATLPAALLCSLVLTIVWLLLLAPSAARLGRLGLGPAAASGVLTLILSVGPLFALVCRLAGGRRAAELIGSLPRRLLLTATLALLLAAGAYLAHRVASWARASGDRWRALLLVVVLTATAFALHWADAHLYRRLYGYLHALLLVAYLLAALLSASALLASVRRPPRRSTSRARLVFSVVLLAGVGMLFWRGRQTLRRDAQLRFVAMQSAAAAAKIFSVFPVRGAQVPLLFLARPAGEQPFGEGASVLPRPAARHIIRDANVILLTVDALRADHLGVYGYRRPTSPTIDRLAARAQRFAVAYCAAPLTCYSVPSLHTGDYLKSTLPLASRPPPTLADILAARGYDTAAFYNASIFFCDDERATAYGKRHFGFRYAETELHAAAGLTDRVLAYFARRRRRADRRRIFLWVHYFDVHEPYRRHRRPHDFGDRDLDRYDSEIRQVDRALSRLMAGINRLKGPTILVITSDHGEEFGEHGGAYHGSTLYEEQVRVPLIFAVPGLAPQVLQRPVELVDVAPTVLALLGSPRPPSMRGRSLVAELLGREAPARAVFSEVHTKKMARLGRWKLIHDFRSDTHELYDLSADPREKTNAIARNPLRAGHLKVELRRWFDRLKRGGRARPDGIDLGRIGDRRAVAPLARLLDDHAALRRWRIEAARLLGRLRGAAAAGALHRAALADDRGVAIEAAIALGEMKDIRARSLLTGALATADNALRIRAAIALGRVDRSEATPALIEGLFSSSWDVQHRAAHYLGYVGDLRAVGPLITVSRFVHLRARAAVALGRLGRRHPDRRILPLLLGLARHDDHEDVRQRSLAAIAYLGDPAAVAPLRSLWQKGREPLWLAEALTRLGAVGPAVAGVDLRASAVRRATGWGPCHAKDGDSLDAFTQSTYCETKGPRATVSAHFSASRGGRWLIRLRPLNAALIGAKLHFSVDGRQLAGAQAIKAGWQLYRWPAAVVARGLRRLTLSASGASGAMAVDHILIQGEVQTK